MASTEQVLAQERLSKSFTPHRPIDFPELLSGRSAVLYRTIDAVNTTGLHVVLYGDRGIGKTSIAHVLAHQTQDPQHSDGWRSLLASCSSLDSFSSIWQKVFQEILLAQRQMGFAQHAVLEVTGRLELDAPVEDPNQVRLLVQSLPNPYLIVLDEFDRLPPDSDAPRLMADTIKLFADTNMKTKIVIVGVAESIGELIAEHESISRNIAQVQVQAMGVDELSDIIQSGFERAGLEYEDGLDERIANLSQGYPAYTHLLGLWAGRRAVESKRAKVTFQDLEAAIPDALENVMGGAQQQYEKAVQSARAHNLFKHVLLACALANKDSLGRFSAVDVRGPLRQITGRDYNTGAYQSHLAKFCETNRGPMLKKTGHRRHYRWQFVDPQIVPFVRLSGADENLLPG